MTAEEGDSRVWRTRERERDGDTGGWWRMVGDTNSGSADQRTGAGGEGGGRAYLALMVARLIVYTEL